MRLAVLLVAMAACARQTYTATYVGRLVETNEIAAHTTLHNKKIVVVGTVVHAGMLDGEEETRAVTRPVWGTLVTDVYRTEGRSHPYAIIAGDEGPHIICVFEANKGREAAGLSVGSVATLKGRVTRVRRDGVVLQVCRVE